MPAFDFNSQLRYFSSCLQILPEELQSLVEQYSSSKDNADSMLTSRFCPLSSRAVIGNKDAIDSICHWLSEWEKSPIDVPNTSTGRKHKVILDDSDFYPDDVSDEYSDCEDRQQALLVIGPAGCGKTSTIYALCNEKGFKVVEINASATRSGKVLTEQFKAATGQQRVDANSLLRESFSNCDNKFANCFKEESHSKSDNVTNGSGSKPLHTENNLRNAFNKLFHVASKPTVIEKRELPTKDKLKNGSEKSSKKGPLDGWISKPKEKTVQKVEKATEKITKLVKKRGSSQNGIFSENKTRTGTKRKSNSQPSVIVLESDDDSTVDSITIETSDSDEEFQVKRKKKTTNKKLVPVRSSFEDSPVKCSKPSVGLTLDMKTLYLIDEADIVFSELDAGFSSALCRLIERGKKPFILTANVCDKIDQSLLNNCYFVSLTRPSENELCKLLAVVVLSMRQANVPVELLKAIAKMSNGDVRRAVNWLHFCCYGEPPFYSQISGSSTLSILPSTIIVKPLLRNVILRSEFDAISGQVDMHWLPTQDSIEDERAPVEQRSLLDRRNDLELGAGKTLHSLVACFNTAISAAESRNAEDLPDSNEYTSEALCNCLNKLVWTGREGFAEHLLCGRKSVLVGQELDRERLMRFAECASAIRDICRSEYERKATCNDRQRRRFFHYLNDCDASLPDACLNCLSHS